MSNIFDKKVNIISFLILTGLTYLLNFCNKIYECALIFTCIILVTNCITFISNRNNSLKQLSLATLVSFIALFKMPYYIDGQIINGLVFASFVSLIISTYWSSLFFNNLKEKYSFLLTNFISIFIAAVIDGFVMGLFFLINNKFSILRIIDIFVREISYKTIYDLAFSIILFISFKIFILIIKTNN
jgi:hypothetical protein